jgi:hypothetical protein
MEKGQSAQRQRHQNTQDNNYLFYIYKIRRLVVKAILLRAFKQWCYRWEVICWSKQACPDCHHFLFIVKCIIQPFFNNAALPLFAWSMFHCHKIWILKMCITLTKSFNHLYPLFHRVALKKTTIF